METFTYHEALFNFFFTSLGFRVCKGGIGGHFQVATEMSERDQIVKIMPKGRVCYNYTLQAQPYFNMHVCISVYVHCIAGKGNQCKL